MMSTRTRVHSSRDAWFCGDLWGWGGEVGIGGSGDIVAWVIAS